MTLHVDEAKKLLSKKPDDGFLRDDEGKIIRCLHSGEPLVKHDPDDRDDTHRGLQYPH